GKGSVTLTNPMAFSNLVGTSHDDVITGNARDNAIYGAGGADAIDGQAGDDQLYAGYPQLVYLNFVTGNGPGKHSYTQAEPDAISDHFIGLTSTMSAHELGHLSRLRHGDAFGPIGTGLYAGFTHSFAPAFPGGTGALTTPYDIMASPGSVGSTLFDAANLTP